MRDLFKKIETSSTCDIGKKEKKNINKELGQEILDLKMDYKIIKCRNKTKIVAQENMPLFFYFNKKYFPTIPYLEENETNFCTVFLDDGAIAPINRGADIMAPGVLKYKEMVKGNLTKGCIVIIRIIGKSIIAVGESLIDHSELFEGQKGIIIEVYHKEDDALHRKDF